ncbi:MAG: hypothetical protein PWQ67_470 [Clostridia bacterium]|jgi:hypothetical protein|nr:hypothetical protein [Clostridia bacterium]MDN5322016.1 hypothetical protein [Clostridia bacterium]
MYPNFDFAEAVTEVVSTELEDCVREAKLLW